MEASRMRVQRYLIIALIGALLAAPAGAQSVKKVTSKANHELHEAGKGIKHGAKEAGGEIHHALTKVGKGTKKVARKAKHGLKKSKAVAHAELTKAGKDVKRAVKPDRS